MKLTKKQKALYYKYWYEKYRLKKSIKYSKKNMETIWKVHYILSTKNKPLKNKAEI